MKGKFIIKIKLYYYFVLILIILFAIFAFYLSCKSKSPTEATSALHDQVSAQSTNNTTTSSSTTTTSRPGSSPTNTTTLITSRTLTTTSTRTTTTSTSIPATSTSSRKTTTTTRKQKCELRWCQVVINGTDIVHNGDTYYVQAGQDLYIDLVVANDWPKMMTYVGTAILVPPPGFLTYTLNFPTPTVQFPPDGSCVTIEDPFTIHILGSVNDGDSCTFGFASSGNDGVDPGKNCHTPFFNIIFEVPNNPE